MSAKAQESNMQTVFLGVFPPPGTRFSNHIALFPDFEADFVKPLQRVLGELPQHTIGRVVFFPRNEEVGMRVLPESGSPGHAYTPTDLRVELIRSLFLVHVEACLDCNHIALTDSDACMRVASQYVRAQNAKGLVVWYGGQLTSNDLLRHYERHERSYRIDGKVGVTCVSEQRALEDVSS